MNKKVINTNSYKIFSLIVEYFLVVLFSYTFFKLIKIKNCLTMVEILGLVIPIIFYLITNKLDDLKNKILVCSTFLFILTVLPFASTRTYDFTIDGNSYHKTAIGFIKDGWNPIYESSLDFQKNKKVPQIGAKSNVDKWIDHYPKATWIVSATMYNMTNNIESGKSINIILIIAVFLISYSFFQAFLNKKISFLLAVLLSLNPINLSQLFSYYLDGLVGICFACELILLLLIKPDEKQDIHVWVPLASVCAIFVNLKYTGLLYSGLIAAVFYFYWIFKLRKEKEFFKYISKITINFCIVFITSIFFIGSNSYIKNTIEHKNPLYPIIGKDKIDIVTSMQPKIFNETSMPVKFVWSLFSKTENVTYSSGNPNLKIPFRVYKDEVEALDLPDTRIGGFGPLFAPCFCISIVMLIISLMTLYKKDKEKLIYFSLPLISIIITSIAVGENWWARYVPQLYFIPIISLISILMLPKENKTKIINVITVGIILITIINIHYFGKLYYQKINSFIQTRRELIELSNNDNTNLQLNNDSLYGLYYNLKDYKINYNTVEITEEDEIRYIFSWKVKVKLNE